MHGQNHEIVEKPHRLGVGAAHQLVDGFDQLMRAEHFGGMQSPVEPDDAFAFFRKGTRLLVGQPLGLRELPRNLLVALELLVVFRRRDDRHQLRAALSGLADLDHFHAVGLFVELLPVVDELCVGRELVVVADVEPEVLLRRRHGRCRLRRHTRGSQQRDRHSDGNPPGTHEHSQPSRWNADTISRGFRTGVHDEGSGRGFKRGFKTGVHTEVLERATSCLGEVV